ncbi:hypothetical protein BJX70DRAFT_396140 [Aspergillus crustosus]
MRFSTSSLLLFGLSMIPAITASPVAENDLEVRAEPGTLVARSDKVHAYPYNSDCTGSLYEWEVDNADGGCITYDNGKDMYSTWFAMEYGRVEIFYNTACSGEPGWTDKVGNCWIPSGGRSYKSFRIYKYT